MSKKNLTFKFSPTQKAWALLFLVLAMVFFGCAIMLREKSAAQFARKQELISKIEKWSSIANSMQTVEQNYATAQTANLTFSATLKAQSDTQAASKVQALVRRSLQRAGVDIRSMEPLELKETGRLSSTGVQVSFSTPAANLNHALRELESTTPRMEINQIVIRQASGNRRAQPSDREVLLEVKADAIAYIRETAS